MRLAGDTKKAGALTGKFKTYMLDIVVEKEEVADLFKLASHGKD